MATSKPVKLPNGVNTRSVQSMYDAMTKLAAQRGVMKKQTAELKRRLLAMFGRRKAIKYDGKSNLVKSLVEIDEHLVPAHDYFNINLKPGA